MRNPALLALFLVPLAACECAGPPAGPDAGPDNSACERIEVGQLTLDAQQDVQTIYSAQLTTNLGDGVFDFLVFNFVNFNERVGPAGVGTFALDQAPNDNRATCAECVSVFEDQLDANAIPGAVFFQRAGSITLEVNPRTRQLIGRLEGLVLEEVTIGGNLESTPVEGGRCLRLDDLELDFRFVPDEWTCDPDLYQSGGVCNCDCGAQDPDCFCDPFQNPDCPAVIEDDCPADTVCTGELGCAVPCDPFILPGTQCAAGELCQFSEAGPVCGPAPGLVNNAALGEVCQGDSPRIQYCALNDTLPAGACDDLTDICRPICGPAPNDCPAGQSCFTFAGGGPGDGYGYCVEGNGGGGGEVPEEWTCDPDSYSDALACDCQCGAPDPDCEDSELQVFGCQEGQACVEDVCQ